MANQWFRMYHEFATDPKVQMLSEVDQRRYVMILCSRCCNGDVTLQDDEIAFQLRINVAEWSETKAVLINKKLIGEDNKPTAWDKRQFISDSSTERVARHRGKKQRECNVTVTPPDTDTDTDTDTEKTVDKSPAPKQAKFDYKKFKTPDFIDRESWNDWMEIRKRKRAAMSELALSAHLKTLEECESQGFGANNTLTLARKNEWKGLEVGWVRNALQSQNMANLTNNGSGQVAKTAPQYIPPELRNSATKSIIDSTAERLK
jgi:hypothetical protein